MVCCSNPGCKIIAHSHTSLEDKRFLFGILGFEGKTCFEIAHYDKFAGVFVETTNLESRKKRTTWRGHRI